MVYNCKSKYIKLFILIIVMFSSLYILSGCSNDKLSENTNKVSLLDKDSSSFVEKIPIVGGIVKFTGKLFKFIILVIVLIIIFVILYIIRLIKNVIGVDSTSKQLKELNKNIKESNDIRSYKNDKITEKHSNHTNTHINTLGVVDFKEIINKNKKYK